MTADKLLKMLRTPGHRRALMLRRFVALVLVAAAGFSMLSARKEHPLAVVFARDVPAGHALSLDDVTLAPIPASALPETKVDTNLEELEGRVVVSAGSAGEILTETRLLGPQLVDDLVNNSTGKNSGEESHMIPLKPAEPDILPHLHHGDTVNVIAGAGKEEIEEGQTTAGSVIAAGGRVITTTSGEEESHATTVLLALPASQADAVAAASLSQPLTVVIVGQRATGMN